MPLVLTAAADDDGRRLDRILRKALKDLPLSAIHRLLRKGAVLVDNKPAAPACRIQVGQTIRINSEGIAAPTAWLRSAAKEGPNGLDILFEGKGLLIVNKPPGLAVHGKMSLEDRVLAYLEPKLPPSLSFRPGPLHRLDRPSSGIVAFSTNLEGARLFSSLMRERKIKKSYLALVTGTIEKAELWADDLVRDREMKKTFIGRPSPDGIGAEGKTALTKVAPLLKSPACTLILAEIETGRTHQIRAQAAAHGHPLLGDKKYSGSAQKNQYSAGGFLLHAWRMEFGEGTPFPPVIEAPLPERFCRKIEELGIRRQELRKCLMCNV